MLNFNGKLDHLSDKQKYKFLSSFSLRLNSYFNKNNTEDQCELQEQFRQWRLESLTKHRAIVDYVLNEVIEDMYSLKFINKKFEMTWRDVSTIEYGRWHICETCKTPFIDVSRNGRSKNCYHYEYQENYSLSSRREFKSQKSDCQMKYRNLYMRKYNKKVS